MIVFIFDDYSIIPRIICYQPKTYRTLYLHAFRAQIRLNENKELPKNSSYEPENREL